MRIYDIIEPLKSRTKESQGPQQKCRAQKIHCQAVLQRGPHLHNIIRPFTQTNMMPWKEVSLTSLKGETLLSFWPAKWPKWLACRWIPFFLKQANIYTANIKLSHPWLPLKKVVSFLGIQTPWNLPCHRAILGRLPYVSNKLSCTLNISRTPPITFRAPPFGTLDNSMDTS